MRRLFGVLLCLVLFTSAAARAQNVDDGDPTGPVCSLGQIAWLSGAWETSGGRTIFRETWVRISEDTWEGAGQVLAADDRRVQSAESLRLVGMAGGLYYVAKVDHNDLPIAFAATECSDDHVVFENPDHDFPKRIAYRRVDGHHITVHVGDGAEEGFMLEFARADDK